VLTPESVTTETQTRAVVPAEPVSQPQRRSETLSLLVGVGILLLGLGAISGAIYGLYEWLRPLSAMEVCLKLDAAKTVVEAKPYVTPRMYPVIEAMYGEQSTLDPNDAFEFTQEIDGPANTKLVGFRMSMFVQEEGQRMKMEGHLKLIKADGWKIDDIYFTGIEGRTLPEPFSVVTEQQRSRSNSTPFTSNPNPTAKTATPKRTAPTATASAPKSWYDQYGKWLIRAGIMALIAALTGWANRK
jgi:hypothetical protein